MKVQYVGDLKLIRHGVVTRLTGNRGIVLFDSEERQSAYFNVADCCHVALGESGRDVKFTSAIDVSRSRFDGVARNRRIVAFLGRSPDWVYVWAYESEYQQIANAFAELELRREQEADNERSKRIMRQVHIATMRKKLALLGFYRIAQAHKFDQEAEARPAKPGRRDR